MCRRTAIFKHQVSQSTEPGSDSGISIGKGLENVDFVKKRFSNCVIYHTGQCDTFAENILHRYLDPV